MTNPNELDPGSEHRTPALSLFDTLADELGAVAGRIEREAQLKVNLVLAEVGKVIAELKADNAELRIIAREAVASYEAKLAAIHVDLEAKVVARLAELRDGKDGRDGIDGKDGAPGLAGKDGAPGESIVGPKGEPGLNGKDGRDGSDGKDGLPGADGKNGLVGPPGRDGADGKDGPDGKAGEPGPAGRDGTDGPPGKDGPAGRDGVDGPPGINGRDGDPGPQGERGADGKDGRDGLDGAVGKQGPPGQNGKDGVDGAPGERGERGADGSPGKLPIVKGEYVEGDVYYEADVVTFNGGTYQAKRDTAKSPQHADWICLAAAGQAGKDGADGKDGRNWKLRGTYDPATAYQAFDVVTSNSMWFAAKKDNPGPCPGAGWQSGPVARRGEKGERGDKGPKGEQGAPGRELIDLVFDDKDYTATFVFSDGTTIARSLRKLFEPFETRD